ncbi:MAG: hypothetical protein V3V08_05760 [Nannocystaceae bacterium]
MASEREFFAGIYREHFEELGFMYERRLQWLDDPEMTLDDVAELEERMEAHLDGLVLGGTAAGEVCGAGMDGEDAGTLYAAAAVFCRAQQWDGVEGVLAYFNAFARLPDPIDADDVNRSRKAIADALAFHAPAGWRAQLVGALEHATPAVVPLLARCIGYRRFHQAGAALCKAAETPGVEAADVVWALGRVQHPAAVELLRQQVATGAPHVATPAAISALRSGDRYVMTLLKRRAATEDWPAIPLAIGGTLEELPALLALAEPSRATPQSMIALGVLGELAAAPRLLEALNTDESAQAAAIGLYLLTGAAVVEETAVPAEDAPQEVGEVEAEPQMRPRLSQRGEAWRGPLNNIHPIAAPTSAESRQAPASARHHCLQTLLAPLDARVSLAERLARQDATWARFECDRLRRHMAPGA